MTKSNARAIYLLVIILLLAAIVATVCCVSVGTSAYAANQAVNEWEATPFIHSWQYGGKENSVSGSAKYGEVRYSYYRADANDQPTGEPQATLSGFYELGNNRLGVGTYVVKAVVDETSEYTGLETSVAFKVLKGVNTWRPIPSITPWDYGKYNASANEIKGGAVFGTAECMITNTETSDIYYKYEIGSSTINRLASAPAGFYRLTVTVAENKNYNGLSCQIDFRIYESAIKWKTVPNIQGWTEGDVPNEPMGEAENSDGTPIIYKYKKIMQQDSEAVETKPTAAGSYEMIATANSGKTNELTARVRFSIASSESLRINEWKILPRIDNWIEGETPSEPIGEAKNGSVSFIYKDSQGKVLGAKRPTAAGEYILVATASADYYEELENEYGFKIEAAAVEEPKDNAWKIIPNIQGWTKGDTASVPVGKANAGDVTFSYKNVANDEITQSLPTEIGEYVLIATVKEDGYNDMTAEVAFRITEPTESQEPIVSEEHDNTAWLIALLVVSALAALLCSGYIAIVIILQKRGISLFSRKSRSNNDSYTQY